MAAAANEGVGSTDVLPQVAAGKRAHSSVG